MKELKNARLLFAIGKDNVSATFENAIARAGVLIGEISNPQKATLPEKVFTKRPSKYFYYQNICIVYLISIRQLYNTDV
ncbi:MAG: hypothetical protein ABIR31_07630 [Ginsengibacter sp.]